jgi:hypothetical protein
MLAIRQVGRAFAWQPKGGENARYRVERYVMPSSGVVSPLLRYTSVAS